jgi:hemolysin III
VSPSSPKSGIISALMRSGTSTLPGRPWPAAEFPTYSAAEAALDRLIHLIGLPAGCIGTIWLMLGIAPEAGAAVTISLLIYICGLIGMLAASAAYHLSRAGSRKELLRRIDHAAIFVMIAGSYTPFAINALPRRDGPVLCAAVWLLAAIGATVKLTFPRRFERILLALYLGMGWMMLTMIGTLVTLLPREVLVLLQSGGAAYSLGALVHLLRRVPFHNVVWHALVLVGAGLHLAAVELQFA